MAVTFGIDDVERATDALPTRTFAEVAGDVLAIGGNAELPVVEHGPTHPLLGAVHLAFAQHRALVLSPDAVWLTIAQGVAQHVRLHAEALRPRLVRHAGKKILTVTCDGEMPTEAAAWTQIVGKFRDCVGEDVGEGRARLLECDFSTTTEVERVASQIVLMDVYSPYFDYYLMAVCGIPEITLLGTPEDWRSIRARIDVIAELDLGWWTSSLAPIADQFVRAASGDADIAFWKRIYNPRDAYGGELITGWITRLYPYLQVGGRISTRNRMLELALGEPSGHDPDAGMYSGPGVRSGSIPAGPSRATVIVQDFGRSTVRSVWLDGGVVAVTQDDAGRLMPVCGWVLRDALPMMHAVIERIRAEHQWTPAPERDWREQLRVAGPADLVALYDQLDGAVLFAERAPWRIRSLDQQERIDVGLPKGEYGILRLIDLPDGTYLALAHTHPPVYVRGRADAIVPPPPPKPPSKKKKSRGYTADDIHVYPESRKSSEAAADMDVVGTSLAELLTKALDSGGELDLPPQAKLLDRVAQ